MLLVRIWLDFRVLSLFCWVLRLVFGGGALGVICGLFVVASKVGFGVAVPFDFGGLCVLFLCGVGII